MWRGLVLGLVAAVALSAGCGSDDPEVASTSSTTDAPTTTASTTTLAPTSTTAVEPVGDVLPDGTHFGYLTELNINDTTATGLFDLAQLFTGDDAVAAAAEDGVELDTDYYIRNVNPKLRAIEVDPRAEVSDIDYDACCEPQSTNIADFAAGLEPPTPVKLTVEDGIVTVVEELYFP